MKMTQEKAIKHLKALKARCERLVVSSDRGPEEWQKDAEALDMALTALRPVSREQVEKVWRGEWISTGAISCKCSKCNKLKLKSSADEYNFCPHCMAAMTAEAVQMVMERINEMEGTENGLG